MADQTLSKGLEDYVKTLGKSVTPAEAPMLGALRLMAKTLDAQTAADGPVASLLSTYTRELARFQKARSNVPAQKSPLATALEALSDDDEE